MPPEVEPVYCPGLHEAHVVLVLFTAPDAHAAAAHPVALVQYQLPLIGGHGHPALYAGSTAGGGGVVGVVGVVIRDGGGDTDMGDPVFVAVAAASGVDPRD